MRIVVSDSSCLIDLRKASLLDAFLRLPYEILIPNTLFEDELLRFTAAQKRAMIRRGLKVVDLPGERVLRARQVIIEAPQLSIHDGFAFALAESHPGCILLTGDSHLRTLAQAHNLTVHGVLWVIDELHDNQLSTVEALHGALRLLAGDPAVRLPRRELRAYIRRYSGENSTAD
jgi:predicted nucleic acid-binding protein